MGRKRRDSLRASSDSEAQSDRDQPQPPVTVTPRSGGASRRSQVAFAVLAVLFAVIFIGQVWESGPPDTAAATASSCVGLQPAMEKIERFYSSLLAKSRKPRSREGILHVADIQPTVTALHSVLQSVRAAEQASPSLAERDYDSDFTASALLDLGADRLCLSLGNTASLKGVSVAVAKAQGYEAFKKSTLGRAVEATHNASKKLGSVFTQDYTSGLLACGSRFMQSAMKREFFSHRALGFRLHNKQGITLDTVAKLRERGVLDQMYIDVKRKFIYCAVPKAGSTELKAWMLHNENLFVPPKAGRSASNVHNRSRYNEGVFRTGQFTTDADMQAFLNNPEYFKFTVARSPYTRVLASYIERYYKCGSGYGIGVRPPGECKAWRNALLPKKPSSEERTALMENTDLSFAKVLQYIKNQAPVAKVDYKNAHWVSVADVCGLDSIVYDFVGRMEDPTDMEFIFHHTDTRPPEKKFRGTLRHSQGTSKKMATYYTQRLLDDVTEIYRTEVEVLGYKVPNL
eukprot:TRINITY_DN51193_c0_g1_i1.p1 TRINITY_DN51193_c0_g1~~TRINITY_DN51193_c0_g1_i1.p1  ORF type:complete len:547 (+),score=153.22 TRINITY_DN51193_c0_g1_i1:98-1642(+)